MAGFVFSVCVLNLLLVWVCSMKNLSRAHIASANDLALSKAKPTTCSGR